MKSIFLLFAMMVITRNVFAAESFTLYAQGCHTFWEKAEPKYECAPEENINIELKSSTKTSQEGKWTNQIKLGDTSFIVSLEIKKLTLPNGAVISSITGQINQSDDAPLATMTSHLTEDLSISLASMVPYGEKKSAPHFFFGTPLSFSSKVNRMIMRDSLARLK